MTDDTNNETVYTAMRFERAQKLHLKRQLRRQRLEIGVFWGVIALILAALYWIQARPLVDYLQP